MSENQTVVVVASILSLALAFALLWSWLFGKGSKTSLHPKSPKLRDDDWPIVGSLKFFNARWDFFDHYREKTPTGNFSFHVGPHHVVGGIGKEFRKAIFEDRRLSFNEGKGDRYAMLFGETPGLRPRSEESIMFESSEDENLSTPAGFGRYFQNRIIKILRPEKFFQCLPALLSYAAEGMNEIEESEKLITDPFDSIYKTVFRFTVRTVGCEELADDTAKSAQLLDSFEKIERSSTPASVVSPRWLLTPGRIARFWGGWTLYSLISKVAKERRSSGQRREDAMQLLLDHGDSVKAASRFVINAVYSGQVNTGINAAYVLCHLATSKIWLGHVRAEVLAVVNKYTGDTREPLETKLKRVPGKAWCNELPVLDACSEETIRVTVMGAALRWNGTTSAIELGKSGEVIPPGSYAAYHVGDVHLNPKIHQDPETWDPSRFLSGGVQNRPLSFLGWGAGRHPCLGEQFAKLEQAILTAFFISKYEATLINDRRETLKSVPTSNRNTKHAEKPKEGLRLKLRIREEWRTSQS